MNSLLLSMPGSPILYYGDEIGMGDNFYLGDRNGVRTPMQWGPDRNGGFSHADPQRLFLPPIMDPIYGFSSVNVEAQSREPNSLLNWTKRMLHVRRSHPAFGRGSLEFLKAGNRKILAYVRRYDDDALLCVANLARSAQPVELDLSHYQGRVPVELLGRTAFPPIGELPYLLTLPGHGFFWFELAEAAEAPSWHEERLAPEEPPWLVLFSGIESFIDARSRGGTLGERLAGQLEREVLPDYLRRQRWFAEKQEPFSEAKFSEAQIWRARRRPWLLGFADIGLAGKPAERYFLPLALCWDRTERAPAAPATLARVRQHAETGALYEAIADERFCLDVLDAFRDGKPVPWAGGELRFEATSAFERLVGNEIETETVRRTSTEGSNSTLLVGQKLFIKLYRRLQAGINPEWEMGRHLTERSPCGCIAEAAGAVELHGASGEPMTLMLVQAGVVNQGDGWAFTLNYLDRYIENSLTQGGVAAAANDAHGVYRMHMQTLAARTADMHRALAVETGDAAFDPEPFEPAHLSEWRAKLAREAELTLEQLANWRDKLSSEIRPLIDALLTSRAALERLIDVPVPEVTGAVRTRYHGDYHLGQCLLVENDFVITDLEGEPGRSFGERRSKDTVLKDLAGMLRSLAYAKGHTERRLAQERPSDFAAGHALLADWNRDARHALLEAYRDAMHGCPAYPASETAATALIELAELEKLLYEVRYELSNRPLWLPVPLNDLVSRVETSTE
jgi:maltose alpha-D-glucosyltransferase/alpha-amylase